MMRKRFLRQAVIAIAVVLSVVTSVTVLLKNARSRANPVATNSRAVIPTTVLWAWERPTDLSFIDPKEVGVAFLARTIRLSGDEVIVRPRLQRMNLPQGSIVIAVARIETDRTNTALFSQKQLETLTNAIAELARLPTVSAIQIDFDAARSERAFYRNMIVALRARLPKTTGLTITALASWCGDDDWISGLPIDEAVPMLFRMGPDRDQVKNLVSAQEEFSAAACRGSYGISTDEQIANLDRRKRLYVFNPEPWTEESVRAILEHRK